MKYTYDESLQLGCLLSIFILIPCYSFFSFFSNGNVDSRRVLSHAAAGVSFRLNHFPSCHFIIM